MMWICKSCGSGNSENYEKCAKCGTSREPEAKPGKGVIVAAIGIITITVIAMICFKLIPEKPRYSITLTAVSDEKTYDGTPLQNRSFEHTELADDNHRITADCDILDSDGVCLDKDPVEDGVYIKKIKNAHIYSGEKDITDQYDITTVDGTLTITSPKPINMPKSTPEPMPMPEPTPIPRPSIADMEAADSRVTIPEDDSWLEEYEIRYVKSGGGVAIALRYEPIGAFNATTGLNYIEDVLEASEVTVLAEQGKFSLIQTNNGSIGWVKSEHLVTEY